MYVRTCTLKIKWKTNNDHNTHNNNKDQSFYKQLFEDKEIRRI